MSDIKTEIIEAWDPDYSVLGGEEFSEAWLDDPVMVARLRRFFGSMHGRILDGTHMLEGDERAAAIDRIQQEQKDVVWQMTAGTPAATEEEMSRHLEHILFCLTTLTAHEDHEDKKSLLK